MTITRFFPRGVVVLGLGVILFAVSAKLALVHLYGTDQPYSDQWAAEGMYFLRGPLYYDLTLDQIVSLQGEHRPALTRLWVRGLILANEGQWDCYVELVANLLVYAAFLAVVWTWVSSVLTGRARLVAAGALALLFALPCAYENFLWGFQVHFMLMLLLGALHITVTLREVRPGLWWWLAQVAGFLGLFSLAAGAMSAAALVVLAVLEILRGRRNQWAWATLVVNLFLLGLGMWMLPSELTPAGSPIQRVGNGVLSMGYLLSWPFTGFWPALLLHLPWVVLLVNSWLRPARPEAVGDQRVGAWGLWVACLAFAIGYGRGVTSENIGVRYYDVLIVGLFVNIPALLRMGMHWTGAMRWTWRGISVVWLACLAFGLWNQNRPANLAGMFQYQNAEALEQRQVVRDFLDSKDPAPFQEFANRTHRFPHFDLTLELLSDPQVRALLPPTLTTDGHENRLSRLARRVSPLWKPMMALGVVLALLGGIRLWTGVRREMQPGKRQLVPTVKILPG